MIRFTDSPYERMMTQKPVVCGRHGSLTPFRLTIHATDAPMAGTRPAWASATEN